MSAAEETRNDRARVAEATANAIRDALTTRVQELEAALEAARTALYGIPIHDDDTEVEALRSRACDAVDAVLAYAVAPFAALDALVAERDAALTKLGEAYARVQELMDTLEELEAERV